MKVHEVILLLILSNVVLSYGILVPGYINVNKTTNSNIFFWVAESQNDPLTDPVVLWMSGGPGCSGELAFFYENGLYTVDETGHLDINQYSWNSVATVIWIDQPAGTGYSYANTDNVHDEAAVADEMRIFLMEFFNTYTNYQFLNFYISGESYAGRYVPTVAQMIINENNRPSSPKWVPVNLMGVSIGNGVVDPVTQYPLQLTYAYDNQLISYSQYQSILPVAKSCEESIKQKNWDAADQSCPMIIHQILQYAGDVNPMNINERCNISECFDFSNITNFLNLNLTKEQLGVPQNIVWQACNYDMTFTNEDQYASFSSSVSYLLSKGLTVLIYYGDLDLVMPWNGGLAWTSNTPWIGQSGFQAADLVPWVSDGEVAGWMKTYRNLYFVRLSDSGHMAPHDSPVSSLDLFTQFVYGTLGTNN